MISHSFETRLNKVTLSMQSCFRYLHKYFQEHISTVRSEVDEFGRQLLGMSQRTRKLPCFKVFTLCEATLSPDETAGAI